MNSAPDEVIQSGPAEVQEDVSISVAPKPKRIARSRELAMLLENISNLAPSPAASSDCDSGEDAAQPLQRTAMRGRGSAVAKSSANVQSSEPFSAPAASPVLDQSLTISSASYRAQEQQHCDPLHDVASYRGLVGGTVELTVSGAAGLVYGDIIYADDSSLAAAAVHAGVLSQGETKSLLLYILGPYKGFVSAVRNGISSHCYPKWPGSFAFVPDALERAAAAATERKRALQERRAAKKENLKNGAARGCRNSSESGSSQCSSSSDSERAAAHWDIPAVPEHLQALAEHGMQLVGAAHKREATCALFCD